MNRIRRICHSLAGLSRRAGVLLASAAAPAVLWADPPRPRPPGWNKHPPLPAHTHLTGTTGMPSWQIILVVAALLAVTVYRIWAARQRATASAA
jgi:hypothetical protein